MDRGVWQVAVHGVTELDMTERLTLPENKYNVCVLLAQLCPTLCDPMDCSPPGSSVHGISEARILECVAIAFSGDLPDPGIEPASPALVCVRAKSHRQILYHWPPNGTVLSSFALSFMLGLVQQNLCTGQVPGPW